MIDVSKLAGRCPRCVGRRVWRVSVPTDEWSCVPNDRLPPFTHADVRDHDAAAPCDDPASAIELMRAAQTRTQVI